MKYLILMLAAAAAPAAFGGLYPVVTNLTTTINNGTSLTYRFQQELVDLGPATDGPAIPGQVVGLAHRHYANATSTPTTNYISASLTATVAAGETIGEAALRAYQITSGYTSVGHTGAQNTPECVGYVQSPRNLSPWSSATSPAGSCVAVPPGNAFCDTVTPTVTFDHGILMVGSGRNEQLEDLEVMCSSPLQVRIVFGPDVIQLATNVQAQLDVPNSNGGLVSLAAGTNIVPIRSAVDVTSVADPGAHSGQSVVTIEYF
ncbi:hypothetical protein [Erwinia aphidicola]|uniref:hypothetical protein n=1 Tax=Erwinia aphidicola TaxID=68334 RepID=UPI003016FE4D